jgi:hypothetical protein
MTLNDLKKMVDELVEEGHGDKTLLMDTDPENEFDIEFRENRETDEGVSYIGVCTNDNH